MNDSEIQAEIERLVSEENELRERHVSQLSDEDRARIKTIEIQLDQCWDLLRQRRAREEFGQDPGSAKPRPSTIVENYEQ